MKSGALHRAVSHVQGSSSFFEKVGVFFYNEKEMQNEVMGLNSPEILSSSPSRDRVVIIQQRKTRLRVSQ